MHLAAAVGTPSSRSSGHAAHTYAPFSAAAIVRIAFVQPVQPDAAAAGRGVATARLPRMNATRDVVPPLTRAGSEMTRDAGDGRGRKRPSSSSRPCRYLERLSPPPASPDALRHASSKDPRGSEDLESTCDFSRAAWAAAPELSADGSLLLHCRPQTVEFWVGGDDEVQLRVDGDLVLSRSLHEGMGTRNRSIALDAGSHAIAIDYKQFGGNLRLNIQRTLARQQPGPFLPTELYVEPLRAHHLWLLEPHRCAPRYTVRLAAIDGRDDGMRSQKGWGERRGSRESLEYAARMWGSGACAARSSIVFAVGSHTIYTNNPGEFSVSYQQLAAPWLLRAVAINWLILFSVGSVLALVSANLTRMYAAVLFALGLALWAQGNLWHADYGVLAGRDVDLAQHAGRAPYELAALGGILVLGAVFFRPLSRIAAFASIAFLSVQAVAAAVTDAGHAEHARWVEPPDDIYRFSRDRNVVHIVLDEFQGDVFTEILHQERRFSTRRSSVSPTSPSHSAFPRVESSRRFDGREYRNEQPARSSRVRPQCRLDLDNRAVQCTNRRDVDTNRVVSRLAGPIVSQLRGSRFASESVTDMQTNRVTSRYCSSCRSFATCRIRRKSSAPHIPIGCMRPSGWIAARRRHRSAGTRRAIRSRSSGTSPSGSARDAIGRSTNSFTSACRTARLS